MLLVFNMHKKRGVRERQGKRIRTQNVNLVCFSAPQKKTSSHENCHRFSRVLFTALTIYFLLSTILFSTALISKSAVGQVTKRRKGPVRQRATQKPETDTFSGEVDDIGNFALS